MIATNEKFKRAFAKSFTIALFATILPTKARQ
jgi:hypothetical protein